MLVIVEGVDGSGKSTLIQKIRENVKRHLWIMQSTRRPKTAQEIGGLLSTIRYGAINQMSFLFDRFPLISESIYGPILRDRSLVGIHYDEMALRIKGLTPRGVNPLIIYCRPPDSVIHERVHRLPQMEGVIEHLDRLILEYDFAMFHLSKHMDVLHYAENINYDPLFKTLETMP